MDGISNNINDYWLKRNTRLTLNDVT